MDLSRCVACNLPVLEIEGQFTKLDSFFIQKGSPPYETAGWWHVHCLDASDAGSAWYQARLRNYRDVRRFEPVVELSGWTVLRGPQHQILALSHRGALIELSIHGRDRGRAHAIEGGSVFPHVDKEFHLELEDASIIQAIKDGLVTSGSYLLCSVLAALGIADRVSHPEALERGRFHFERSLQEFWGPHAVSARVEYGVFIPAELVPYVGESHHLGPDGTLRTPPGSGGSSTP